MGKKKALGINLMLRRREAGLSQQDIADAIGVSVGTVGNWERGIADIPFSKACLIADCLDITVEQLAGR